MNKKVYFSVVFYVNQEYKYLNIKYKNKSLQSYYKNIINCFTTLKITNNIENMKFSLFTNKDIEGEFSRKFDDLNIEVIVVENTHIPPKNYVNTWQGVFFYLDCVNYFSEQLGENDILFLVDPDCIFTKNMNDVIEITYKNGIANYILEHPIDYKQNGLSRNELKNIISEEVGLNILPNFFGGEFYGFRGDLLKDISAELEVAWNLSLDRFNNGKTYLHTEEHLFSYVFYKLSLSFGNLNKFIKRMWTAPHYRNIECGDENYIIWHLPSEKERGLINIYSILTKNEGEYISLEEYQKIIRKTLGIPKRSINRYLYDQIYRAIRYLYINIKKIIAR